MGGNLTRKKLIISKDGYCVKGVWSERAHDACLKAEGYITPIKDPIQIEYFKSKKKLDDAIKSAEEYVNKELNELGFDIKTAHKSAYMPTIIDATCTFHIETLKRELEINEKRLLRWGCEYLMREDMREEKEQLLDSFYHLIWLYEEATK